MKPAESASAGEGSGRARQRFRVLEFDAPTRTAADAAAAIGCEAPQIAKSLVFRAQTAGRAVLIIASGADRVDEKKHRRAVGEPIARADADFVREATGFAIGGVPPVGHRTEPIVLIEERLTGIRRNLGGGRHAERRLSPDAGATSSDLTGGTVAAVERCVADSVGNRRGAAWRAEDQENRSASAARHLEPWRGAFFTRRACRTDASSNMPSSKLTSIEINGTYYGSEKPESFQVA